MADILTAMNRKKQILKHVNQRGRGIEIGPWINPIAPKREGFDCLTLDVFDTATLRSRAAGDPNIAALAHQIEEVDLVGSSTEIENITRATCPELEFDYVVSSHNFEHLPNPIRFLQGCTRILKPGGVIAMAIPDHRACFDYFRPVTRLGEWLDSYHRKLDRPSLSHYFDHRYAFAYHAPTANTSALRTESPSGWKGPGDLREAYADWLRRMQEGESEYLDSHVSVFTPSSFELLIHDCVFLGLLSLKTIEILDADTEFHVSLQVMAQPELADPQAHRVKRDALMQSIREEEAEASIRYREVVAQLDATRAKLDATRAKLDAARLAIDALRASRSWRLTAPLRWLGARLR